MVCLWSNWKLPICILVFVFGGGVLMNFSYQKAFCFMFLYHYILYNLILYMWLLNRFCIFTKVTQFLKKLFPPLAGFHGLCVLCSVVVFVLKMSIPCPGYWLGLLMGRRVVEGEAFFTAPVTHGDALLRSDHTQHTPFTRK